MGKRIILLSDGTGNAAAAVWKSNVWRVFESLDLRGSAQVAFYDDGVGTSSFKPLAVLGGAFGWGLKRNALDIYRFLCANYEEGDEVYAFGFSRGAFTIRVVLGLAFNQGLVGGLTDAEIHQNAKMAYRAYRSEKFHTLLHFERPFRAMRDAVLFVLGRRYDPTGHRPLERVSFVGLWDTVAAYGLPVDEMSRGVSRYIWPLELPNRSFNENIQRACHALSLDDERTTFHPVLWNESTVPDERLQQVWFSGVHSNVGGGYPDDSLAHIPLYWMMSEAQKCGLAFKTAPNKPKDPDPDVMVNTEWRRDKDGRLYDSRNGMGGYYRYGPRKIADLSKMKFSRREGDFVDNRKPTIHETAIQRARMGAHRYAPIGIPLAYDLLTDNGIVPQSALESADEAGARCEKQERVWNLVWRRRLVYFLTVSATLYLFLYPLSRAVKPSGEFDNGLSFLSGGIRTVGSILPGVLSLWIDAYARDPSHLLFLGVLVILLVIMGVRLGRRIRDCMERVWRSNAEAPLSTSAILGNALLGATAVYIVGNAYLPHRLYPPLVQGFLTAHVSTTVTWIVIGTLVALFAPGPFIYHLRTWSGYRTAVRQTKLVVLPAFFAAAFIILGAMALNHISFVVQDTNGLVCKQSPSITNAIARDPLGEKGRTVENKGLQACLSAGIASCSPRGAAPTCSNRREVFCSEGKAVCETRHKAGCNDARENCLYDVPVCRVDSPAEPDKPPLSRATGLGVCPAICESGPIGASKVFHPSDACHATGIWLEEAQKYEIKVKAPSPKDADYGELAWRDADGSVVSTRGVAPSGFWAKAREAVLWPLKRNLFDERFKIVARVGSVGNDERTLEPNSPASNDLNVQITPRRAGELFLYVNDAVLGLPSIYDHFYKGNKGQATISVQRMQDAD